MPLNVVDKTGEHLGVVVARLNEFYLAALTAEKVEEVEREEVLDHVAQILSCRNLFRKVNLERLEEKLRGWWAEKGYAAAVEDVLILARAYMFDTLSFGSFNLWNSFPANTYLAVSQESLNNLTPDGSIPLDASKNDIEPVPSEIGAGLAAQVMNYPVVELEVLGFQLGADLADLGVNHTHHTRLQLKSGENLFGLYLSQSVITHRGEQIILKLRPPEKNQVYAGVQGVLAGGVIYIAKGQFA